MDRIRGDRDKREAYIRTLERARDSATRAFEDVNTLIHCSPSKYADIQFPLFKLLADRDRERLATFSHKTPKRDPSVDRLSSALDAEKKVRELAEVNVVSILFPSP